MVCGDSSGRANLDSPYTIASLTEKGAVQTPRITEDEELGVVTLIEAALELIRDDSVLNEIPTKWVGGKLPLILSMSR